MYKEELGHLTLSLFAGAVIAVIFGNLWVIAWAVLSGFLIDGDHLFDYIRYKGLNGLSLKEFFGGSYFDQSGKVILPLHGFEYCLIFAVVAYIFTDWRPAMLALALSLFFHLVFDTLTNHPIWPTYSILFRAFNRFDHHKFDFKSRQANKLVSK